MFFVETVQCPDGHLFEPSNWHGPFITECGPCIDDVEPLLPGSPVRALSVQGLFGELPPGATPARGHIMFDGRGILRGLKGEVLSCGCLIGIYERYRGEVIAMIDAVGPSCGETGHDVGQFVPLDSAGEVRPSASNPAQRQRHQVSASTS